MSVSAPSLSAERAAPVPAPWRSTCAATVVSASCLLLASRHNRAPGITEHRTPDRGSGTFTLLPCAHTALLSLSTA